MSSTSGSFARNEETSESDLDLLVDYDKNAHISLLDLIRYKIDLEQIINREVDLITNGSLKPFAVESANKDKYLIYERKNQRSRTATANARSNSKH